MLYPSIEAVRGIAAELGAAGGTPYFPRQVVGGRRGRVRARGGGGRARGGGRCRGGGRAWAGRGDRAPGAGLPGRLRGLLRAHLGGGQGVERAGAAGQGDQDGGEHQVDDAQQQGGDPQHQPPASAPRLVGVVVQHSRHVPADAMRGCPSGRVGRAGLLI
uniref:Uncharacterized protein n=1 Tax=Nonomuraea gerenzanensis TaxID=93944 RepID=A0A1M4E570_9ACTN|nr:hypothetical protein BN4615_P3440 [Nonomuraea gerenzanensis]